ncbi:hypothetical protein WJX77_010241 [Trebouxia sp. C0004]
MLLDSVPLAFKDRSRTTCANAQPTAALKSPNVSAVKGQSTLFPGQCNSVDAAARPCPESLGILSELMFIAVTFSAMSLATASGSWIAELPHNCFRFCQKQMAQYKAVCKKPSAALSETLSSACRFPDWSRAFLA